MEETLIDDINPKPPHKCVFDKEEVERVPLHNKDGATVAFDVITR